jgi:hypothetical protein
LKKGTILFEEENIILIGSENDFFVVGAIIEMIVLSKFEIHLAPPIL